MYPFTKRDNVKQLGAMIVAVLTAGALWYIARLQTEWRMPYWPCLAFTPLATGYIMAVLYLERAKYRFMRRAQIRDEVIWYWFGHYPPYADAISIFLVIVLVAVSATVIGYVYIGTVLLCALFVILLSLCKLLYFRLNVGSGCLAISQIGQIALDRKSRHHSNTLRISSVTGQICLVPASDEIVSELRKKAATKFVEVAPEET